MCTRSALSWKLFGFPTMHKIMALIGSRKAPEEVLRAFRTFAYSAYEKGWVIRSGGAAGCDQTAEDAFAEFKQNYGDSFRARGAGLLVYLPWPGFRGKEAGGNYTAHISEEALASVNPHHPRPSSLKASARKLMARNYNQVMGAYWMSDPSRMVIGWTPGPALEKGGTSQAFRIADAHNIPYYNLYEMEGDLLSNLYEILERHS